MRNKLEFSPGEYKIYSIEFQGKPLEYRAYEGIRYVRNPVAPMVQTMNIYVPEVYYQKGSVTRYTLDTAPIFLPNTVNAYMPGEVEFPSYTGTTKARTKIHALHHGYVVISPGVRGRGSVDAHGRNVGMAPAAICDLKAVVRYLKYHRGVVPGNPDRIITNGTSAGGALSALLGCTGNHPDYEPFLRAMGAAEESDAVFATSCYCPITNLEAADMAYEWEFRNIRRLVDGTELNDAQMECSKKLAQGFPEYLRSLRLRDELELDQDWFASYIQEVIQESAQHELNHNRMVHESWLTIHHHRVVGVDMEGFIAHRGRKKAPPAFDPPQMGTPENQLFGTEHQLERHFSPYTAQLYGKGESGLADTLQVKMMNPIRYIDDPRADKATAFRIRHGAMDSDTSLAISAILHGKLRGCGFQSDLRYPLGKHHAGDYDLEELFEWIDSIV